MRAVAVAPGVRPLIAGLVPSTVVAAEAYDDNAALPLYPEEWAVIASAAKKRRQEFTTVRTLARACLAQLGGLPGPLLPDSDRVPLWPDGFVGSMTHCDGFRAAAAARVDDLVSIGIDAEPHDALPHGVLDAVTVPEEREGLAALAEQHAEIAWDRLIFSAKESVFKACFPLNGRWIDFTDCAIEFDPLVGTFRARLLCLDKVFHGVSPKIMIGRWTVSESLGGGHIVTSVAIV